MFKCPKCGLDIGYPINLNKHVRHNHTDYDKRIETKLNGYKKDGMRSFDAQWLAKKEAREEIKPQMKRFYDEMQA